MGLVHLGQVREEGHDLLGARRVEDVIEVKFFVPLQTDVPLDVSSCPEHLRGVFQHRSQLAAEFRGQVTDVEFARKVQHLVRGIVRIYHPVVARPARFVADHLHPEIPHRHMPIEVLHIEPVGLRRLFGTLQIEAQPDDVGQRCEPLAVFVGPLAASVNDVDASIAPNLVPRGQRHDKQRFDLLRRQQAVFARRLGRQIADVGKNDGIALGDSLRPPREILHRKRTEPLLLAGNARGRHFVGAVVSALLPVELDDVGPVAAEHRKHLVEDFVDRVPGPAAVQQREQRMRNTVEPVEQVVDPDAVAPVLRRRFEFDLLYIAGHNVTAVGSRLPAEHLPLQPQPAPVGRDQGNGAFGRMRILQQAIPRSEYFGISLRDQTFHFVESYLRGGIPKQPLQKIGHVKYPPRHIRLPPAGPGIFQYRSQYLVFFHL